MAQIKDADRVVAAGRSKTVAAGNGDTVGARQAADFCDHLVRCGVNYRDEALASVACVQFRAAHEHIVDELERESRWRRRSNDAGGLDRLRCRARGEINIKTDKA